MEFESEFVPEEDRHFIPESLWEGFPVETVVFNNLTSQVVEAHGLEKPHDHHDVEPASVIGMIL